MKSTTLITGGSGLLALNWACALRSKYSIVLGLHQQRVSLNGVSTALLNLESLSELERQLETIQPKIVIHTAGLTSVEKCESDPILARRSNVHLAVNLAKLCALNKIPFAHMSTDHLYSGSSEFSDESLPISPINVYGKTKAEAEQMVQEENPDALIIRTNFYGWGTSYRQSLSDFIIHTLHSNKQLELFDDVFFTPMLAESLAEAAHDLIALKAKGVFNIVGNERLSKFDFGLRLANKFNFNERLIKATKISSHPHLVKRPLDMSLSNKKATSFLGRSLGNVDEHLSKLLQQKEYGVAMELAKL
jgi:dTDP-4-dehydrorhamnose reductase